MARRNPSKRSIWKTKDGRGFYKLNLPLYVNHTMITELKRISGRGEKYIIDFMLATYSQMGELGIGYGSDNELYVYVDEDNYLATAGEQEIEEAREYGSDFINPKEGKVFNLTENIFTTK